MNSRVGRYCKGLCTLLLLCVAMLANATHQRAGEISYRYISGLTYEFTITTYTYSASPADRPQIEVFWGDGSSSIIDRTLKQAITSSIDINVYVTQHTFSAAGTFYVSFEDPNRNAGIVNIPNSVEIPFYIETMIVINPFIGGNSCPVLMNPPIDNGCTNVIYYHNPGAYDADGDSLSYSLISCRGYNGEVIPGYTLPYASNYISIDSVTGDLVWDSPTMAGEYNVAILIEEWRNGILISSMVRDMQITIAPCNNTPPEIELYDTCVVAGTRIDLPIYVYDSTSTQATLSATGAPLLLDVSPAQFMPITDDVPYMTHFVWQTVCEHVQPEPYNLLFKAQDNGPQVNLVSFKSMNIRVIAPAPKMESATPYGNTIEVVWHPDSCSNAVGYDIYRRSGSNPFDPDSCETGMPTDAGYEWIGSTSAWSDTVFVDEGYVLPLYHANEYCYRVVALFANGAESIVSDEMCTQLFNDAPLITHADVVTTDEQNGIVHVQWMRPPEIDSNAFEPPYYYILYRKSGDVPEFVSITDTIAAMSDTILYMDHDLNTVDNDHTYKVVFCNLDTAIECSDPATTIFLDIAPSDKRLPLNWSVRQPWNNVQYTVFRHEEGATDWDTVAVTTNTTYTDYPLDNEKTYCYYILAEGYYWLPDTTGPFWNRSQQVCARPIDNEPPELPVVEITTDCYTVDFQWTFSSDTAMSDAWYYYVLYKPTLEGEFTCIDSFPALMTDCQGATCHHTLTTSEVIVGCFAMMVADSSANVTEMTDSTCIDVYECLDYHLPNVFTPNGDGNNDILTPYHPYVGIESVNMKIYNRWGKRVFATEDPEIRWDGTEETTKQPCSDGVYFYSCDVYIQTLTGLESYSLHGSVTIIR
ncbi:MAG: gliding motility-associated C-terminal domain-containing protein [Bacteroidales bacterium]|nr:gliding motility-associated C-terminal domain-containing protein [Bacteroidales bacterium]